MILQEHVIKGSCDFMGRSASRGVTILPSFVAIGKVVEVFLICLVTSGDYVFKGFVRYIFTSFFCMSKREDLWNKEKCFLFHFESSFGSWDNQILNFQIFKCHVVIKWLSMKHEIFLNNLVNKYSLVMKFGQFMQHYKIKFIIKKLYGKCGLETSSRPFLIF